MPSEARLEFLSHVLKISNSSVDVEERLGNLLGAIQVHFRARQAVIFQQEQSKGRLQRGPAWPAFPRDAAPLAVPFGQGPVGECALRREPRFIVDCRPEEAPGLEGLCSPGEALYLWPVMDDHRLYAVLVLILPAGLPLLTEADRWLLGLVVLEMAGTIRNFNLYFEAKRRIAELNVLSDLGQAAISTIELSELLDTVAGICAKLLSARGGLVAVMNLKNRAQRLQALHGQVPPACQGGDLCLDLCPPLPAVGQAQARPCPDEREGGESRGICVSLTFKGDYAGHLCVFDKVAPGPAAATHGFSSEDKNLLATMATMVSSALENALTFQRVEELAERNEEMVGALATLFEISTILMTTVDFNESVRIVLEAVTHPVGLDHDRVALFLVDEENRTLAPVAHRRKHQQWGPVRELAVSLLAGKGQPGHDEGLPEELASFREPLDPTASVLAKCVVEKRAIPVANPEADPLVPPAFRSGLGRHPFLAVPMFAKGKVVGVLVVSDADPERLFGDRERKLLGMLANLGGLSVENSRLYQHLEKANRELAHMRGRLLEADKLAALGEIAAGVAHEIRNPLVSIGGFTRRIRKKVGESSDLRPYLDVIIEEVTRLEHTLTEMLDFSSEARDHFAEHDLNQIMEEALELLKREIGDYHVLVVKKFRGDLPAVYCDDRQIKHVFFNLYLNAIQAMGDKGGVLTLRSFTVMREGKELVAGEVADSGTGIPLEVMHNIFNPFFTTKDSGSGMGLSIVHKIVTRHFGQVDVRSEEGHGATFMVTLPAAEEGRAYLK